MQNIASKLIAAHPRRDPKNRWSVPSKHMHEVITARGRRSKVKSLTVRPSATCNHKRGGQP